MRTRVVNPAPEEREANPCATCGVGVPKTPTGPMSSRERRSFFERQVFQPYQSNPGRGPRQEEPDDAEAREAEVIRGLLPPRQDNPCFGLHVHSEQVVPIVRELAGAPAPAPNPFVTRAPRHLAAAQRQAYGHNPNAAPWIAAGVVAAVAIPAVAYAYGRGRQAAKPVAPAQPGTWPPKAPTPAVAADACAPFVYDHDEVVQRLTALIAEGYTDSEAIAAEVSASMWPRDHGSEYDATYPPLEGAPEANRCVYDQVLLTARDLIARAGNPGVGPLALALNAAGGWGPYRASDFGSVGAAHSAGHAFRGRAWQQNPAPPLPAGAVGRPWFPPAYGMGMGMGMGPDPGIYEQCQASCTEIYGYGTEAWGKCVRSQCAVTPFSRFQPVAPTGTVVRSNPGRGTVRVRGRSSAGGGYLSRRPNPEGMQSSSISLAPPGFDVRGG